MKLKRSKRALIVFAREPKDGEVKTRLKDGLHPKTITQLYKAFLQDVFMVALKADCDHRFICYTHKSASIPFLGRFRNRFELKKQIKGNLGDRMHQAFVDCWKNGFERTMIIGTDCLTLKPVDINMAFRRLMSYDCVLGPAVDGGYYLIGLKKPIKGIFRGIQWGTKNVFGQTLKNTKALKRVVYILEKKEDIDTVDSLKSVALRIRKTKMASHTQKILKKLVFDR